MIFKDKLFNTFLKSNVCNGSTNVDKLKWRSSIVDRPDSIAKVDFLELDFAKELDHAVDLDDIVHNDQKLLLVVNEPLRPNRLLAIIVFDFYLGDFVARLCRVNPQFSVSLLQI